MCLFGVFSLDVSAEEYTDFKMEYGFFDGYTDVTSGYFNIETGESIDHTSSKVVRANWNSYYYFWNEMPIVKSNGSLIAKKGEKFDISIQNIEANIYVYDNGVTYPMRSITSGTLIVWHTDDTYKQYHVGSDLEWHYYSASNSHGMTGTITAEKDIRKIVYTEHFYATQVIGQLTPQIDYHFVYRLKPFTVNIDIQSEESKLLGGILDKITSGFESIGNWFTELKDNLLNGIKDLFIPDEEFIIGFKDRFDELLANRLGAVYQVGDVLHDSWETIGNADETNTIQMPLVSIDLPENNTFEFGGFDVKIVPDRFELLVDWVKLIIGIVCTTMFFNGLLKRYDEVMGVES